MFPDFFALLFDVSAIEKYGTHLALSTLGIEFINKLTSSVSSDDG